MVLGVSNIVSWSWSRLHKHGYFLKSHWAVLWCVLKCVLWFNKCLLKKKIKISWYMPLYLCGTTLSKHVYYLSKSICIISFLKEWTGLTTPVALGHGRGAAPRKCCIVTIIVLDLIVQQQQPYMNYILPRWRSKTGNLIATTSSIS